MVFTFEDYRSLVQMLYEHPEWREELRPLVLSEELLRLPETQARTDQRLDRLTEQLSNLAAHLDDLALRMDSRFQRVETRLGRLDGQMLELRYFNHVGAWFGRWLRRPEAISIDDLPLLEQAIDEGRVEEDQVQELRALDLLVHGFDKREADRPETLLAVEVSVTINSEDVERAAARASILRGVGYRAFGLVCGENLSGAATEPANRAGVLIDMLRP